MHLACHAALGERTLTHYLREWARRTPDKAAIIFYGREISYAELDRLSDRFAAVLQHEMVEFFKDAGSTDMPPPGPPSEEVIGKIIAACQRHGIQMLEVA